MSIKSVCSHQFLRTSWDLKFVVCLPPRLSISIFNTRLKSPPIIWFSLERSSIFWLRFKKNVGLSSFGAYIFVIVSRIPFISISAITYLPSVSIIYMHPWLHCFHVRIGYPPPPPPPPPVFFHSCSLSGVLWVSCRNRTSALVCWSQLNSRLRFIEFDKPLTFCDFITIIFCSAIF